MNIEELFNKEFYIIDCDNYIFFPRVVRAIYFEVSHIDLTITIDKIDDLTGENIKFPIEYLQHFKTFEDAKKEAERLNNLPKNKKRANEWNNPEEIYKRNLYKEEFKNEIEGRYIY